MTLPCCDPSMSYWDQLWSDTCQLCSSDVQAQQVALQQTQGLTTSNVPACDPNSSVFSQLFSNECNATANSVGQALGAPNIPNWAWLVGAGFIGFVLLKR